MIYTIKRFTDTREDASLSVLERAKKSGVIQKIRGNWRIVSIKKKKLWTPKYRSRKTALKALRGYQANR